MARRKRIQTFEERVRAMSPDALRNEQFYWQLLVDRYQDTEYWGYAKLSEARRRLEYVNRIISEKQ